MIIGCICGGSLEFGIIIFIISCISTIIGYFTGIRNKCEKSCCNKKCCKEKSTPIFPAPITPNEEICIPEDYYE